MNSEYKIIAETAFSHEGDLSYLMRQIDAAVDAQADVIKFQVLLDPTLYYCENHPVLDSIGRFCFTEQQWISVWENAKRAGLDVLALPLSAKDAEFCRKHTEVLIDLLEVHSVCFNDVSLLERLQGVDIPVVFGIGGRCPGEIECAQRNLGIPESQIILMYGFQLFPTDKETLNLNKIDAFRGLFSCDLGFADHCRYDDKSFHEMNLISYVKGCRWFEKHLVLSAGEKRTDYESGVEPVTFREMRGRLVELEKILGSGNIFLLNKKENAYRQREKQLVYSGDLCRGHVLTEYDMIYKISPKSGDFAGQAKAALIGRTIAQDVEKGQVVCYGEIQ